MIRTGKKSDIDALVEIHIGELRSQFLPSLGEKFLKLLYRNLLENKKTVIYTTEKRGAVRGYIIGSTDFNRVFKTIILKNFISYIGLIIPQLIKKPRILINLFETIFYTQQSKTSMPKAELVVIAVSSKFRRKGLGKNLIIELEKYFKSEGIRKYKVSVTADKKTANYFYKSLSFKKEYDFFLYGELLNIYTKKIK